MKLWLLQVAGFIALIIDVFVGGALVYSLAGPYVAVGLALAFVAVYVGLILGPLAANTYNLDE